MRSINNARMVNITSVDNTPYKTPSKMTIEELIEARNTTVQSRDDLEDVIGIYNKQLMAHLNKEKVTATIVGKWAVSKVMRTTFSTTLDEARELGATKESVDTEMLKVLMKKGAKIPGTNISEYISVRKIEKKKNP